MKIPAELPPTRATGQKPPGGVAADVNLIVAALNQLRSGADLPRDSGVLTEITRIYVSPSGDDANDGRTTGTAKRTIQAAFDLAKRHGPILAGSWRITLAAGVYDAPAQVIALQTPDAYFQVEGPEVAYGTPTAVIDPGPAATYGLWFGHGMRVRVRNVKIQNVTGNSVAAGVVLDQYTWGWMDNVHTTNTTWAGVNANISCRAVFQGGRYESTRPNGMYGARIYGGSTATIGYNVENSGRPQFVNCTVGVVYQGSSYGHTDFCDFLDCDTGMLAEFRSHSTNNGNTFTNVNVGWQTSTFSSISTDSATTVTNVYTRSRHRSGWATSDNEDTHRHALQYYPDHGPTGRIGYGYSTWHTPWTKHQFSGAEPSGLNLSSFAAASMLLDSSGNTILAMAAASPGYSSIWFGDGTNPQAFAIRYARNNGGADLFLDGASNYRIRTSDFYPTVNDAKNLGRDVWRWLNVFAKQFRPGTAGANAPIWTSGTGTPEGVLSARVGSLYTREDGGAGSTLYVKESGTGNTGWRAV